MKVSRFRVLYAVFIVFLTGCNASIGTVRKPTTTIPESSSTGSPSSFSPTPIELPTETGTPNELGLSTVTATASTPVEARLNFHCLQVAPTMPHEVKSSGVVVLESRVIANGGYYKPGSILLNMLTGVTFQSEPGSDFNISPDKRLMAYDRTTFDSRGRIVNDELVIATADGHEQKVIVLDKIVAAAYGPTQKPIPLLTGLSGIPGWLDNQWIVISLALDPDQGRAKKPATLMVLNPFTGEKKLLPVDFSSFLDTPSTVLPYWDGWYGVIYDPTMTLAIYPRFVGSSEEQFTYGIWDISKKQLVASLENIYEPYAGDNGIFPMPRWSPDGSNFVFRGHHLTEQSLEAELYMVSRGGQIEQLTHLNPMEYVQNSNLSWSPDGRYIAMFLNTTAFGFNETQASVAVLDIKTLEVTDYCIKVTYAGDGYGGGQPPAPIWSPDGTQFLVVDWYRKDHQRVILIDIAQGLAAQIAQDMEPDGWMASIK
jgi:hypothetical protein